MAEEQNGEQQEKKKGGILGKIITAGILFLLPVCVALGLFLFVIRPMISSGTEKDTPAPVEVEGIPPGAKSITFEGLTASTLPSGNQSGAMLMYSVVVACNEAAAEIVNNPDYLPLFRERISHKIRNRTRSEVDDPQTQDSILKLIKQEFNQLLKDLAPDAEAKVFHVGFYDWALVET